MKRQTKPESWLPQPDEKKQYENLMKTHAWVFMLVYIKSKTYITLKNNTKWMWMPDSYIWQV